MERDFALNRRIRHFVNASTKNARKFLTRIKLRRRGSFSGCTTVSLILRPFLERDRFKTLLGAPIMAAVIVGAVPLADPLSSLTSWSVGEPLPDVLAVNLVIPSDSNQSTSLIPVPELIGISQGFHSGHPGIDLRAPLGSPIISMRAGTVIKIENDTFGYGHHLYINHNAYLTTLYAHTNHILVKVGDPVTAGQKVADVGLTGWSTGPHLHFEIYQEGQAVNPLTYLKPELQKLATNLSVVPVATRPGNLALAH
jgi:murein DD-endopeptidase MepM/ murein hydrolase activator NlpD